MQFTSVRQMVLHWGTWHVPSGMRHRHVCLCVCVCVSPYLSECAIKAAHNNDKKLHVFITNCNCTNFIHGRRHIAIVVVRVGVGVAVAVVVVLVASCHIPGPAAVPAKKKRKNAQRGIYWRQVLAIVSPQINFRTKIGLHFRRVAKTSSPSLPTLLVFA